MRKRRNPHAWSGIERAKAVPALIAEAMDRMIDARNGGVALLEAYKQDKYASHTIKTLESDIKAADRAIANLDSAYSQTKISHWALGK